jgi:hypothetical protein
MRTQGCKETPRNSAPLFYREQWHRKSPDLRIALEHAFTRPSIIRHCLAPFAATANNFAVKRSGPPCLQYGALHFLLGGGGAVRWQLLSCAGSPTRAPKMRNSYVVRFRNVSIFTRLADGP